MRDPSSEHESVLVDISEFSLDDLFDLDDSVLAHSIRRIRDDIAERHDAIARFQNYV